MVKTSILGVRWGGKVVCVHSGLSPWSQYSSFQIPAQVCLPGSLQGQLKLKHGKYSLDLHFSSSQWRSSWLLRPTLQKLWLHSFCLPSIQSTRKSRRFCFQNYPDSTSFSITLVHELRAFTCTTSALSWPAPIYPSCPSREVWEQSSQWAF